MKLKGNHKVRLSNYPRNIHNYRDQEHPHILMDRIHIHSYHVKNQCLLQVMDYFHQIPKVESQNLFSTTAPGASLRTVDQSRGCSETALFKSTVP
jgi:hypothetical protein